jgi:uncharacterized RDD family membrane protein YckC
VRAEIVLIRTPEGIEFSLPLAGPFSRMLAFAVDFAVIMTADFFLTRLIAPLQLISADAAQTAITVLYFAISLLYGILTEWLWKGQTIGKRMLGLRVVEASGLRLRPSQIVIRNLLRFLDLLPGLYLVGGVCCVLSARRQRVGDIAAGTIVIRIPQRTEPDMDQILGRKFNSLAEVRHLAARLRQKVPAGVAQLCLEAILRRDEIQPAARLTLFREFADYLKSLVPYPAEAVEQLTDEQYVASAVDVLFRRTSSSAVKSNAASIEIHLQKIDTFGSAD